MNQPIFDPPIPYIGRVQSRFTPGKIIRIQGTIPSVTYRFNINLQCGPQTAPQDDIALQLSVRILDGYIALNSLQHGIWDEEQRNLVVPIKRAERFEIILLCEFNQYKVAINGQHYCEFPQRIHYDRISHLAIDGDVSIIQISYEAATPSRAGAVSGSSLEAPRAPPLENPTDDFELIDSAPRRATPSSGIHSAPPAGFAQPPSYEAVMSAGPPYPTGSVAGMPQPGIASAYPPSGAPGIHPQAPAPFNAYPTYPSSGQVTVPLPPPGGPVPLNAPNSYFKPIQRDDTAKVCGIIFGFVVVVVVIVLSFLVRSR